LHIPGEDKEIHTVVVAELLDRLRVSCGVIPDRDVVKSDIVMADEVGMIGMVGSNKYEIGGGHLADVPSAEEVSETVALLRGENGDTFRSVGSAQGPGHAELPGEPVEVFA
jgi:dissimilatory sulfite reductase (desulfoviridin) alpha/beta subunit